MVQKYNLRLLFYIKCVKKCIYFLGTWETLEKWTVMFCNAWSYKSNVTPKIDYTTATQEPLWFGTCVFKGMCIRTRVVLGRPDDLFSVVGGVAFFFSPFSSFRPLSSLLSIHFMRLILSIKKVSGDCFVH